MRKVQSTLRIRFLVLAAMTAAPWLCLRAGEPTIPPEILAISPHGMERGTTKTFTLDGRNLTGVRTVLFDTPGFTAKVVDITDVAEKIRGPRINVDLEAQVPLGKKQAAKMEVTVAQDVRPGLHWFRLVTPLGTSNLEVLDVGSLPEIEHPQSPGSGDEDSGPPGVKLPATLIGTLLRPGASDRYTFDGKVGQEMLFQVVASKIGSELRSELRLLDNAGKELERSGEYSRTADAVLTCKLPGDGSYTLILSDREKGGGSDYYYRLNAGALPYITRVFPLGVQAGQPATVEVSGLNLGGVQKVKVDPPAQADGWTQIPLNLATSAPAPLDPVKLVVSREPEVTEQEPNNNVAEAQPVSVPVTINGRIHGAGSRAGTSAGQSGSADEDYFRFKARRGEHLTLEVAAARLGSPLDSVLEVLDREGKPIPRAALRCRFQTATTLADRDSRTQGIRLVSTTGIHENDYLMIGEELVQVAFIPDQPDADLILKGANGLRSAFLGTSPSVHAVNTLVYKVEILPPDAQFPPNGLPVFHLTYRNDDGGPGYGADSRLVFMAPDDGEYIAHLKDVRGLEGPDFAYRLTIRDSVPDFTLVARPENPNIPRGGTVPISVEANRTAGYQGPIEVELEGLPKGVTASLALIPAGQESTVIALSASPEASLDVAPIRIVGRGRSNGRDLVRVANRTADEDAPLEVASVIPPPDVLVTTEPREVTLEAGKETTVTLHVARKNGFDGRVPCNLMNLPPGVRVVNIGLNGVLVGPNQSTRTFTLKAADWAASIEQPIYVVAEVESNSPTRHASPPILLKVRGREMAGGDAASKSTDWPSSASHP